MTRKNYFHEMRWRREDVVITSLCGACSIFSTSAVAAGPPVGSGIVRGQPGTLKCTLTFSIQQGNRSRGNTLSYVRFSRSLIGGSDQVLVASATPEPRTRTGQILVKDKGYHVCPQTGPITKFCGYGKYTEAKRHHGDIQMGYCISMLPREQTSK